MRAAVIENGVVSTVVDVPSLDAFGEDVKLVEASEWVVSGATWDGEVFTNPTPPPPQIPTSVTMRQARLALLGAGLLDDIEEAIASIPDPVQRRAAQIEWEYATIVERSSALIQQLAPTLGMTEAQMDELFATAAAL